MEEGRSGKVEFGRKNGDRPKEDDFGAVTLQEPADLGKDRLRCLRAVQGDKDPLEHD